MDDQLLQDYFSFFEVSSKDELREQIENDVNREQKTLDEINQEIQLVSEGKVNSNWMLIGVDSTGIYSLRTNDYASGGLAASVKNIGSLATMSYHNSTYLHYVFDKLEEQDAQEKSGIPKNLYNYKK